MGDGNFIEDLGNGVFIDILYLEDLFWNNIIICLNFGKW